MTRGRSPTPQARALRAQHTLAAAATAIGRIESDASIFTMTLGEYSMLDAILHAANCAGECALTLWTWTVAEYEISALSAHENIKSATLFVDADSKTRIRNNTGFNRQWREAFGESSIRYIINHAKMATIESATHKILIRGSANANQNNKLEQLDITAGGLDFDLVRRIESEIPESASDDTSEAYANSKCGDKLKTAEIPFFKGLKQWAK